MLACIWHNIKTWFYNSNKPLLGREDVLVQIGFLTFCKSGAHAITHGVLRWGSSCPVFSCLCSVFVYFCLSFGLFRQGVVSLFSTCEFECPFGVIRLCFKFSLILCLDEFIYFHHELCNSLIGNNPFMECVRSSGAFEAMFWIDLILNTVLGWSQHFCKITN